jgi:regulator of replication initiation timing
MYNDTELPATEAFEAMKQDLKLAKASRNELALENMKLKRELEEERLKRDQWAKMLKEQGILS